jgi:branched-chain amino acid transport system substrate-binding protein
MNNGLSLLLVHKEGAGHVQDWAALNPGMKNVAQFVVDLDPTWVELAKNHADALAAKGIKTTDYSVTPGVDVSSVVVKAMAAKPDGYVVTCDPDSAGKIAIELDKRGLTDHGKVLYFITDDDPGLYATGGAALKGSYIYTSTDQNAPSERWQALRAAYKADSGSDMIGPVAQIMYDSVYLMKQAIETTGITGDPAKLTEERAKLVEFYKNVKGFDSVMGAYDIIDNFGYNPWFIEQINDPALAAGGNTLFHTYKYENGTYVLAD